MSQERGAIATEPVRVDVRSVETELAGIWQRAIEGTVPGVTAPLTRTILSNLLVYASSDAEADAAKLVITEMAAEHPARVVMVDAEPGEPGRELQADVSMLCSISERGRTLCGEEVRLHAHGVTTAALGSVMPVLVADLAVYLWTPGQLVTDDVLRQLTQISDHWIIDSRRFDDWTAQFKLVTDFGPERKPPLMLHDLAWTSISQWREAIAQHFDPQSARRYLCGITDVEITYKPSNKNRPDIEAVLIAAWLIHQLGWQQPKVNKEGDGSCSISTKSDGRQISIVLSPTSEKGMPVGSIEIKSTLDGEQGTFCTAQGDHPNELWLEADAPGVPSVRRTIQVSPPALSVQICQVLNNPGMDRLYERILPVLQGILSEMEARR